MALLAGPRGVRALAVASVIVFHAAPDLLPGGFPGADAFFVLSGFLVIGLLLAMAQHSGATRLRAGTLAAPMSGSNWWAVHHGATCHRRLWSLGIEGQFCLLWPLLLVLALKRRLSRRALLALCLTGAGASAMLCAVLYRGLADTARVYNGAEAGTGGSRPGRLVRAGEPAPIARVGRTSGPPRVANDPIGAVQVRGDGLTFTMEGVRQVIAPWLLPRLRRPAAR